MVAWLQGIWPAVIPDDSPFSREDQHTWRGQVPKMPHENEKCSGTLFWCPQTKILLPGFLGSGDAIFTMLLYQHIVIATAVLHNMCIAELPEDLPAPTIHDNGSLSCDCSETGTAVRDKLINDLFS